MFRGESRACFGVLVERLGEIGLESFNSTMSATRIED